MIDQLEVHLSCGNYSEVQFLGHKMKSSGLNLGQDSFAEQCEYFENLDPDTIKIAALTHVALMRTEYANSVGAIKIYLEKLCNN
jgi:hypothetical protein